MNDTNAIAGFFLGLFLVALGFGLGVYWHAFHDWDRPDGAQHRALRCEYAKARVEKNLTTCLEER